MKRFRTTFLIHSSTYSFPECANIVITQQQFGAWQTTNDPATAARQTYCYSQIQGEEEEAALYCF